MAEILCPTCGRPNPDDHNMCDFCGSPLTDIDPSALDGSSLRDELFSQDDSDQSDQSEEFSRLDQFFSEPEPKSETPLELDDFLDDSPDDPFSLDDRLSPEEEPPEIDRPQKVGSDDLEDIPFQMEDFLPEQDTGPENIPEPAFEDSGFRLDDLLSSDEADEQPPPEELIDQENDIPPDDLWFDKPTDEPIDPLREEEVVDPLTFDQTPDESETIQEIFPTEQETLESSSQPSEPSVEIPTGELWDEPAPSEDSSDIVDDAGWLDMLVEPDAEGEVLPDPPVSEIEDKPQTDWLDRIKRLNKSADHVDEDSSFPDWLSATEKAPEEMPDEISESEQVETESSKLPSWLQIDEDDESLSEFLRKKDLSDEEYRPKLETDNLPEDPQLPDSYTPPDDEDSSQSIKFPSWAEGDRKSGEIPDEIKYLSGEEEGFTPTKVVDPFQGEDDYLDDLFSDDLPEWLTTASAEDEILPFEEEIISGELPGWVEAMRPVVESTDTSGLSDDEDYIENYGPLAGIPSVLPAEADIVQEPDKELSKPLDLVATKVQQENVNLIKRMIGDEGKSIPIQIPAPIQSQRILRWLISVILLVTIAGMVIFGGTYIDTDLVESYSLETGYGSLYTKIENLTNQETVLIAFDYQPAAAGELHAAAAGIVDHLMEQGTYLSLLSTEPTGPALAEYFLEYTQEDHNYKHTQNYINLGYLPGESAGLLSFIYEPDSIIPLAFDGSNAWDSPPLINVNNIQDFAMILVITDDPNTAKNWIEQVGTILDDTPLTMVVSAQVEPLIQPYFRGSPQLLNGYVSGLIDSMNYESLLGRPNLAHLRWLPFNMGIIISVGTIFIGGLANGILSLFSRHRARLIGDKKK
jgi:hypothetical protein